MPTDGCAECGFGFAEDPPALVSRCGSFPLLVKEILDSVTDDQVRRRPTIGTWAPIEYAAHVADAVAWYTERIERVLQEAGPQLEPFDFDAAAEAQGYCRRNIGTVTTDVSRACAELADLAMRVGPVELRRCGRGSDGSPRSVASLLARAHHELVHHELDLRRGASKTQ